MEIKSRNTRAWAKRTLLGVAIVALAMVGGYVKYGALGGSDAMAETLSAPSRPVAQMSPSASTPIPAKGFPDFSAIVDAAGPAVVNISISGSVKMESGGRGGGVPHLDPDDPFSDFLRRFQPRGAVPIHGLGSGFIVTSNGIVLTNAHVVDGADEVTVKLTDKREFKAKVLGMDKLSDIAVLKVNASNLPTVRLGNPEQTRVGEWALAIGSPFGFENSATAGIVSAKSRSLPDESYVPFIQTDVAVNPGNSGGPLFNGRGEVIGINSQIFSRTGGYQGLSFAIPIDVAIQVEREIVAHGKVERARLGVAVQDVDQGLASAFGLKKPSGALISSVDPAGPASQAGLAEGDVILRFNDKDIDRASQLSSQVISAKPGTKARLQVWRKGATRDVDVTLGKVKEEAKQEAADATAGQGQLGLAVRPLTADERRQIELNGGLLVEGVTGLAAKAGIQPGDVIVAVNGEPVRSVEHLRALVKQAGKHMAMLVQRDDKRVFVALSLE
ncbi:MAG TPA: DegQ family serine endoprotease [Rhodocyclaceae bacterium]|nr:DegQ family serine endoprotease [Rhodocyclaceae bacterium]